MAPIGIKYYKCSNNGTGVIIYPQLRNTNDTAQVVWDGFGVSGFTYCVTVGLEIIVDLATVKVPENTTFFVSCKVVNGEDDWDSYDTFVYDPKSDLMAFGQKYGPVGGGGLEYGGVQLYNVEREMKILEKSAKVWPTSPVSHFQDPPTAKKQEPTYVGNLTWPLGVDPDIVQSIVLKMTVLFMSRDMQVSVKSPWESFYVTYNPKEDPPKRPNGVPLVVWKNWSDAFHIASKVGAEDKGITVVPTKDSLA